MPEILPLSIAADELARFRASAPLVHILTNEVVQEISANVLLAAGASPAMNRYTILIITNNGQ